MFEVVWMEFNKAGQMVTKRKSFETEGARERFVQKLFGKDSFYKIIAFSD